MKHLAALIAAAVLSMVPGCGGDNGDAAAGAPSDPPPAEIPIDPLEATSIEFTNLETGSTLSVASTFAVSLEDGAAYTVFLTDFDLDTEALGRYSSPQVPEDGMMVTVFVTIFNATEPPSPLEAGQRIEYTSSFDELTFGVVAKEGDREFGNNAGAEGVLTITSVGSVFTFDIEYSDNQKTISGSVAAPVRSL